MKRILSSLIAALLCTTLSAQDRLNFFELVADVLDNNLSLTQFQQKYNQYFVERSDEESSIFSLKNIDFLGYEGTSIVTFEPEDQFMVSFITMESPSSTSTHVQRTFFKTLEIGKPVTKHQITSALEVNSLSILT